MLSLLELSLTGGVFILAVVVNSQKNELVIETLEMAYTNLIRMSIRDTEDTKKEQFKQWL